MAGGRLSDRSRPTLGQEGAVRSDARYAGPGGPSALTLAPVIRGQRPRRGADDRRRGVSAVFGRASGAGPGLRCQQSWAEHQVRPRSAGGARQPAPQSPRPTLWRGSWTSPRGYRRFRPDGRWTAGSRRPRRPDWTRPGRPLCSPPASTTGLALLLAAATL